MLLLRGRARQHDDADAALDDYLKNEPYVVEHVWEKIETETVNVVIVNGKKVGG